MQEISELRLALKAAGFSPIPVNGKRALLPNWTAKTAASDEEILSWGADYPYWTNTGILTGFTPAFDIDIKHPDAAEAIEQLARDWFDGRGTLPVRFGNFPKRALIFRTETPFLKMKAELIAPDGSEHKIEVLGDGQQLVAAGINPDIRAAYTWSRYDLLTFKRDDLPEIDAKEAADFLALATETLISEFGFRLHTSAGEEHTDRQNGGDRGPVDIEAELAAMKPTGVDVNDVQSRVIGAMVSRAYHPDEIISTVVDATMEMAERCQLKWTREREIVCVTSRVGTILNKEHKNYDPATGEIPSWLAGEFHKDWIDALLLNRRPVLSRNRSGWHVRSYPLNGKSEHHSADGEKATGAGVEKAKEQDTGRKPRVVLTPFVRINPADLPPRHWLYGRHYQRRVVSATVAPGGTGKTSQGMVEAVALATCRNLLGEQPEERCRVWLHNGEDSREELNRRIIAICEYYDIPQEELEGWLYVTSGTELGLKVANGYSDLKIDNLLVEEITRAIANNAIDVFVVDPLVTLHNVDEKDNGKMDTVIRIFTRIADVCECAIDVSHHTRKLAAGSVEHTVDDARGASAIRDAVRMLRILNVMSIAEAGQLGMDEFERLSYFRVDQGKANTVAPAKKAVWRKFENVELANGDNVGVVTAWDRPDVGPQKAEHDRKAEALFLRLLDRLWEAGRYLNDVSGPHYAPTVLAREQEAKAAKIGKAALGDAMRRLFRTGVLRAEEYGPPSKGKRRIVRASPTTAPHEVD